MQQAAHCLPGMLPAIKIKYYEVIAKVFKNGIAAFRSQ
jgi:hypothetical protein